MKKLLLMKTTLLLCALIVGSSSVWADSTATFDWTSTGNMGSNATGTVGSITLSVAGNSGNTPAVTSNTLRIYAHRADGNGASATFTADANYKISAIQVTSSNGGTILKYATDGGSSFSGFSFSNGVATVSNLDVSSITLKNCQNSGNSNTTVQISKVVITYAASGGNYITVSPTTKNVTNVAGNAEFTITSDQTLDANPTQFYTTSTGDVTASKPDWITSASFATGTLTLAIAANTGAARTAYFRVEKGSVKSSVITITQAAATHTITYSVNGIETPVSVNHGEAISFAAPASGIPTGYVFKGWRTSTLALTDTDPNDYVTSGTCTADVAYYAVMAVDIANPQVETLTQSEITTNLTNTTCAYGTAKSYTDGDIKWTISAYTDQASRPWMQLKKDATSYIKVEAPGIITGLTFTITSATNSSGGVTDITKHTAYSGSIYVDTSAKNSPTGGLGSTNVISSNQMSLSPTGNNNEVYMQVSTGARVWGIEVTYNKVVSVSNFCTTVPTATVSINAACTDGEGNYYGTYSNSKAFVVPADLTVSEINIDDSKLAITNYDEGDIVPANTGVMVSSTTSGNHTITLAAGGTSVLGANNKLYPSGDAGITAANMTADNTKFYRLTMHNGTKIGFWWGAAGGAAFDLAANKAYLAIPNASEARAGLWFGEEDVTAIETVKAQNVAKGEYFNLAGQRVAQPTKGLYIVNGRKVIVK